MKEKSTGDLERELLSAYPKDIAEYINNNKEELIDTNSRSFTDYMSRTIKEKGLQKQDVFLQADIPQGYGYKLLSEEKHTRQGMPSCGYALQLSLHWMKHSMH